MEVFLQSERKAQVGEIISLYDGSMMVKACCFVTVIKRGMYQACL